jgi:hypothetical protein
MAVFTIQTPDGRKLKIEAPDEATAIRGAQEWTAANPPEDKRSGFAQLMAGADPATLERSENVEMAVPSNPMQSGGPLGGFNDFSNAVQSGFNQGLTFGFGDELFAGVTAPFAALGPMLEGGGYDLGKAYESQLDTTRQAMGHQRELNPIAAGVGEIAGAITNPLTRLAGGAVSQAPGLGVKSAIAAGEGAALGGLYGAGSADGDLNDRLSGAGAGALTGGLFGAAAPAVSKMAGDTIGRAMQRRATNSAIRSAPSAADLKAASSAMFQQVDNSGVTVEPNSFGNFVAGILQKAVKDRMNPTLDPKAYAAFQELASAANDALKGNGVLTISDLHTLRQIAQKAAMSAEGRDYQFAQRIIDGLDNFITQPGATVLPRNRLGSATSAPDLLKDAIGTWARASKAADLERAIYRAQNAASGFENGLRVEFRKLLNDDAFRGALSRAEREALEDVVRGNAVSNLTKLLGKFGFGSNNMLGGTIGASIGGTFLGGVPGALATAAVTSGARKVSEKLTQRAAERAARVVATPNVPNLPPINLPRLPPAFSLPLIDHFQGQR